MSQNNQPCREGNFKTEVEEKVQNNNVELESFTDVDIDERTEPEVTESKFETEVEENSPLMNCSTDSLVKIKRVENLLQTNCQFVCNHYSYEAK